MVLKHPYESPEAPYTSESPNPLLKKFQIVTYVEGFLLEKGSGAFLACPGDFRIEIMDFKCSLGIGTKSFPIPRLP